MQRRIFTLVVPPQQYKEYKRANPGIDIEVCKKKGIGNVRQWLFETFDQKYLAMFDDDMYFYHRRHPESHHLAGNTPSDNVQMLDMMMGLFDKGYKHVGVAARPEACHHLCNYRTCCRINNVHIFDTQALTDCGAKFNVVPVMEDFDVILTMLEYGYKNAVVHDYVWNQQGSNTAGGCSDYRTAKVQARAAHMLAKLHPNVVKVIEKEVRGVTSWEGMKTRTDVRIQWRKSYSGKPLKRWRMEHESSRHLRKKLAAAKALKEGK